MQRLLNPEQEDTSTSPMTRSAAAYRAWRINRSTVHARRAAHPARQPTDNHRRRVHANELLNADRCIQESRGVIL
jgi:hypothetical protein